MNQLVPSSCTSTREVTEVQSALQSKQQLDGGWIYILLSSADYTRCKVGRTIDNPLIRFGHLSTGDPCLGLQVVYFIPTYLGSIASFEGRIHKELEQYRIKNHNETNTEWFRLDASGAEHSIDRLLENWSNQKISSAEKIGLDVLTKMYASDIQALFQPDAHELKFARDLDRHDIIQECDT